MSFDERLIAAYNEYDILHLSTLDTKDSYKVVGHHNIGAKKVVVLLEGKNKNIKKYWANKAIRSIITSRQTSFSKFFRNLYKHSSYSESRIKSYGPAEFYDDHGKKIEWVMIALHVTDSD